MISLKFCSIPKTLFSVFLYLTRPLEQGKIYARKSGMLAQCKVRRQPTILSLVSVFGAYERNFSENQDHLGKHNRSILIRDTAYIN